MKVVLTQWTHLNEPDDQIFQLLSGFMTGDHQGRLPMRIFPSCPGGDINKRGSHNIPFGYRHRSNDLDGLIVKSLLAKNEFASGA